MREGSVAQIGWRDSSFEFNVIAGGHEQAGHTDLQNLEPARVRQGAQAPRVADDLVRSWQGVGGSLSTASLRSRPA
jgi:hypothetical protein